MNSLIKLLPSGKHVICMNPESLSDIHIPVIIQDIETGEIKSLGSCEELDYTEPSEEFLKAIRGNRYLLKKLGKYILIGQLNPMMINFVLKFGRKHSPILLD